METLYSDEVKRVIRSYDWPPGNRLRMEVDEEPLTAPTKDGHTKCLTLVLFRDNFSSFDGTEQLRIAKIIGELIPKLNSMGVPTQLRVAKGDGRVVGPE